MIEDFNDSATLSEPMLQRSRIIRSRDEWRSKTVQRAEEIREHRKTQKRYQDKIAQLKAKVSALEHVIEDK